MPLQESPQKRALVIDDYEDNAEVLAMLLRRKGYDAEFVLSGAEALEKCRTERFDVVVSDIGMPEMNGYEVARSSRTCAGGKPVLIAMTGLTVPGDRVRATAAGFDALMRKPLNPDLLLMTIERLLRKK